MLGYTTTSQNGMSGQEALDFLVTPSVGDFTRKAKPNKVGRAGWILTNVLIRCLVLIIELPPYKLGAGGWPRTNIILDSYVQRSSN